MPLNPKQRLAAAAPPYDDDTRAALDALGPPLTLFGVFARRPERAMAIHGWGRYYLSPRTALTLRHRELVINRTTARCGAEYEWGVHVAAFAAKAELTPEQVTSTAHGSPGDACWPDPADRAVLAAVDALCGEHDIADELWLELVSTIGEEGALDLLLVCGWYHAISFVARVARLPLETFSARFADYAPSPAGPPS